MAGQVAAHVGRVWEAHILNGKTSSPNSALTEGIQLISYKFSQMIPIVKMFPLCPIKTLQGILCPAHNGYRALFTRYNRLPRSLAKYVEM